MVFTEVHIRAFSCSKFYDSEAYLILTRVHRLARHTCAYRVCPDARGGSEVSHCIDSIDTEASRLACCTSCPSTTTCHRKFLAALSSVSAMGIFYRVLIVSMILTIAL